MPAPSGTVWGNTAGGYGRIGIYTSVVNTDTQATLTVQIWFWSKYSVSDSNNALLYDNLSKTGSATTNEGSVNISTSVASGDGWSTSNQVKIAGYTSTHVRVSGGSTRYIYAQLGNVDRVGATMYASTTVPISGLPSYAVRYDANGGTGAPSLQVKRYGETLTLSTAKPTRTGYTFQGWATSASATTPVYSAGASYTANAAVVLYAVWKANTYTVKYNANGGTGAPANQTKTYGLTLKLSSTKPTRTNHTFKGWATSASATAATYASGANFTENVNITLYAVWELNYTKPRITKLSAVRGTYDGSTFAEDPTGTTMRIKFTYECDLNSDTVYTVYITDASGEQVFTSQKFLTALSGDETGYFTISLSSDASYNVRLVLDDTGGSSPATTTLSGSVFAFDALPEDKGIAFGKAAELEGVAEFAYEGKFNKPVYGKALGMDRLPAIPENSDFNNYMETGCYAVQSNSVAETVANIPVARAGRLEVWASTGEGVRAEQWSYLRQRFIPYNSSNAVWERELTRGEDNVWHYYDWWRSSLTPEASQRVYSKAALTASISSNVTFSTENAYTHLPLNTVVLSTSDRLTVTSGSIRIGADIKYIKVSGQVTLKAGTGTGNRHIRIQKVSGGTTTSVAWTCIYAAASNNTLYALTPVIVSVKEGDLIRLVYYTSDSADYAASGSAANGWQTYLTVEEL